MLRQHTQTRKPVVTPVQLIEEEFPNIHQKPTTKKHLQRFWAPDQTLKNSITVVPCPTIFPPKEEELFVLSAS